MGENPVPGNNVASSSQTGSSLAEEHPQQINAELCLSRLNALYEEWDKGDSVWGQCDALFFLTGHKDQPEEDEEDSVRHGIFHLWLFTLIFPGTLVILFKDRRIAFSARGKKKMAYFHRLSDTAIEKSYRLEFYLKNTNDIIEYFKNGLLQSIQQAGTPSDDANKPLRFGTLLHPDSIPIGKAAEEFMQVVGFPSHGISDLDEEGLNTHPLTELPNSAPDALKLTFRWKVIDLAVSKVMINHTIATSPNSRLSAAAATKIAKDVLFNRIIHIINRGVDESHAALCDLIDEKKTPSFTTPHGLVDMANVDVLHALVESGTKFTLDTAKLPNDDNLNYRQGSIVFSLGVKYNDNAATLARTVFIDVGDNGVKLYQSACNLQQFILSLIKPNVPFNHVYKEAAAYADSKCPNIAKYLKPCFGGALTNKLLIDGFCFDAASENEIMEGMVIMYGVSALDIPSGKKGVPPLSIWLFDTCYVLKAEPDGGDKPTTEVWTESCSKKPRAVCLLTKDGDEEGESKARTTAAAASTTTTTVGASSKSSGTRSRETDRANVRESSNGEESRASSSRPSEGASNNRGVGESDIAARVRSRRRQAGASQAETEKLLTKQRELRRKKEEEIAERFRDGGVGFSKDKKSIRNLSNTVVYRDVSEFPRDLKPNKLSVDVNREAILVPIGPTHVPFHASAIRNVSSQGDDGTGKSQVIRISFFVPGATKTDESPLPDISTLEQGLFIKEVIIRSSDPNTMSLVKAIRELSKGAKNKEANQRDEVATQQALSTNRTGKRVLLRNLSVRYTGGHQKKTPGQLEAHLNGVRYTAPKNEPIDIIYSNVKHAYFQPVNNEMIVLLHFHLKSPIMVARKKVTDVQFYCESASQSDDLDMRRNRSVYDPDEILEEQRELEKRKRLNLEFRRFVEGAGELSSSNIEFEIPVRELAFMGVPRNSAVTLMPTSNCLVQLTEWPPFILTMEEVELVSFERVSHGLKHFDIAFVFKDYNRSVSSITSISVENLDMIKSWLNDMDLVWYESRSNLNWTIILKVIKGDISGFVKKGGFSDFLGDDVDIQRRKQETRKKPKDDSGGEDAAAAENDDDDDDDDDNSSDDDDDDEEYREEGEGGSSSDEEEEDEEEEEDHNEEKDEEEDEDEETGRRVAGSGGSDYDSEEDEEVGSDEEEDDEDDDDDDDEELDDEDNNNNDSKKSSKKRASSATNGGNVLKKKRPN